MPMKLNKITKSLPFLLSSAIVLPSVALAQVEENNQQNEQVTYEKIEVTTSRRVQTIQDVPASVVAVRPEEFILSGNVSLADVVGYAPGFHINQTEGQRGRGQISARGVNQQSDTAVTAIYLDDVPMTSNSGFASGGSLYFDGMLGDIERIELIKGPQGTLYGSTAIAGAVRYITKDPALDSARGSVSANLSTTKEGGFNQTYRGFASIPLVEDTLGLTVAGFSLKDDGYVDQVDGATGEVIKENANKSDDYGYSADLLYKPSDKLKVRVKGLKQKTSFGIGSAVRLASLDKEEAFGKFTSDGAGYNNSEQSLLSASLNYEFDSLTLNATSSHVSYETNKAEDYLFYAALLEPLFELEPGTITAMPFTNFKESEKTVHELRLTSNTQGNIEWLAGLFYTNESTENQQLMLGVGLPDEFNPVALASFPSEYKELAAYGNVTYYITPEFDITAGMRYSSTELGLDFLQDGILVGGYADQKLATADDNVQTYLFAARYRPSKDTSFYARAASGYRPASSILTISDPITGEQLSQSILKQDDLWSYELGVKGDMNNGAFRYDTSLWYIDWQNFQTSVTYFGLTTDGNAEDGITAYGFDSALTFQASRDLVFNTNIAYSNSTLNSDEPGLYGLAGAQVPRIPKWTFSANAVYDFEVLANWQSWLTAGLRYVGSAPSAFENGAADISQYNIDSDAYTMLDMSASFESDNILISLYVKNLTDNDAYVSYVANDSVGVIAVPLQPRTIGASLTYSF